MMKVARVLTWVFAGAAALGLQGCRERRVVVHEHSPRETVYVEQPRYVIVRDAPPPLRVERRPSRPSSRHVWLDGYWHWNGRRYVWQSGRWMLPPRARAVWVAPRYERHDKDYWYTPGQWREPERDRKEADRDRKEPDRDRKEGERDRGRDQRRDEQ